MGSHHAPPPDRVSSLELFFDLVFVFTITQVAEAAVVVVPAGLYGSPAAALAAVAVVIFATIGVERATDPSEVEPSDFAASNSYASSLSSN